MKRRAPTLAALRSQVNEKRAAIGKPHLEGDWKAQSVVEGAGDDALSAKKEIEKASITPVIVRDERGEVMDELPTTDQEHLRDVATGLAQDVAESLPVQSSRLHGQYPQYGKTACLCFLVSKKCSRRERMTDFPRLDF